MQRPTIKTIAQETGLSIATVSKALKHSPQVRPETRAIVPGGHQAFTFGLAEQAGEQGMAMRV